MPRRPVNRTLSAVRCVPAGAGSIRRARDGQRESVRGGGRHRAEPGNQYHLRPRGEDQFRVVVLRALPRFPGHFSGTFCRLQVGAPGSK